MRKIALLLAALSLYGEEQDIAKISEAMGHIIGKNLQSLGVDFDLKAIAKGWQEEMEGKNSPLNEEECVQAIVKLQEQQIVNVSDQELQQEDALDNGDQVREDHFVPAPDPSEYR